MLQHMLRAIVERLRPWLSQRTAACAWRGPADHADLKRLNELSQSADDLVIFDRLR